MGFPPESTRAEMAPGRPLQLGNLHRSERIDGQPRSVVRLGYGDMIHQDVHGSCAIDPFQVGFLVFIRFWRMKILNPKMEVSFR